MGMAEEEGKPHRHDWGGPIDVGIDVGESPISGRQSTHVV